MLTQVQSFTREPAECRSGDWLLVRTDGVTYAGCVAEIIELFMPGRAVLRMLLRQAREVEFEDDSRGRVLTVSCQTPGSDVFVRVETMSFHEILCDAQVPGVLSFNYLF